MKIERVVVLTEELVAEIEAAEIEAPGIRAIARCMSATTYTGDLVELVLARDGSRGIIAVAAGRIRDSLDGERHMVIEAVGDAEGQTLLARELRRLVAGRCHVEDVVQRTHVLRGE